MHIINRFDIFKYKAHDDNELRYGIVLEYDDENFDLYDGSVKIKWVTNNSCYTPEPYWISETSLRGMMQSGGENGWIITKTLDNREAT